jgi:hypothetical protein
MQSRPADEPLDDLDDGFDGGFDDLGEGVATADYDASDDAADVTGDVARDGNRRPDVAADGRSAPDPIAALWGAELAERYRAQWRELQLKFVDEPQVAASEAATLVDEAVQALTNAIAMQQGALDEWQSHAADSMDDTETLRVALRRYRDFLDRLLGL